MCHPAGRTARDTRTCQCVRGLAPSPPYWFLYPHLYLSRQSGMALAAGGPHDDPRSPQVVVQQPSDPRFTTTSRPSAHVLVP